MTRSTGSTTSRLGGLRRLFSRRATRALAATALGLGAICAPSLAQAADKVLVIQWPTSALLSNAAGPAVQTELTALGYDVTLIDFSGASVPANVADFKQVYVISIGLTPDADAAKLVTYVQGGGHLYVTGDRPDPSNDLESQVMQEKILKLILKNSSALQVGTGVEAGGTGIDDIQLVAEKTGLSSHPNALTHFYMGDPGIIGGVPAANVFAKDMSNNPVGAVWTQDDLLQGNGCVMLMEDINWWNLWQEVSNPPPTHADVSSMAANVAEFMKYCGDHDLDGILDGDEPGLGTDPANPDSDGDGLCDGSQAVNDPSIPQTCIAGENAKMMQDTDGDGMIDALDPDDDNDGIPTKTEVTDVAMFGNPDTDNVPAWLDTDSDGDGVSDMTEGRHHFNTAGVPDYLDPNYPTPQPTSAATSTGSAGGAGGVTAGVGATSATGSGTGGGDSGGDSGGCGCAVADAEHSPARALGLAGLATAFAAAWSRSRRKAR